MPRFLAATTRLGRVVPLVVVIAAGLASRRFATALPPFVAAYAGDALWAAAVFLLAAMLWPHARTRHLAAGALAFAVAIEVSQLYHAPWIDAVRATRPGALVLGHGFLWSDLACYAVGIGAAALLHRHRPAARSGGGTTGLARWAMLAFALLLVAIVVAADRAALPGFVKRAYAFPGGDKVGHALLFGGLAFLATLAFPRRTLAVGRVQLPLTALIVAAIVAVEEASQALFPGRTLSLTDLAASLAGIAVGAWGACVVRARRAVPR